MATGFNLIMNFDTSTHFNPAHRQCDFDREVGKVRECCFLIFLQIPFFSDLGIALFPISMGSGQTARASSPATQHQILTRTLESSKAPVSPPQSGYTHPPHPPGCSFCPLPTQLFLTTGQHPKCPVSSLPLCLHPPHPTPPQPARLAPNYC